MDYTKGPLEKPGCIGCERKGKIKDEDYNEKKQAPTLCRDTSEISIALCILEQEVYEKCGVKAQDSPFRRRGLFRMPGRAPIFGTQMIWTTSLC